MVSFQPVLVCYALVSGFWHSCTGVVRFWNCPHPVTWFDHSVPQKCWLHLSGHAVSDLQKVQLPHPSFKRYIFRLCSTMIVWDCHGFPVFHFFWYGRSKINVAICSLHLCPMGPMVTEPVGIMKMPHVQRSIWLMGILADQSGKIQLVLIMVHLCRCQTQDDLPRRRFFQEWRFSYAHTLDWGWFPLFFSP